MSFGDISRNNPLKQLFNPRTFVFSWQLLVLQVLFLGLLAITIDKPTGSLTGRVSLEEKGFNLSTYNMRDNRVYALVNGPRAGADNHGFQTPMVERGAWVKSDGTFQIDQLPVGEYSLRVRAPGFSTQEVQGVFVEEGHINALPQAVGLSLLNPTVNIAAECRTFTTKEPPHFWVNATGASETTVKIYKKDLFEIIAPNVAKTCGLSFSSDFGVFVDSSQKFRNPFEALEPVKVFNRKLEQNATDDAHAEFKFDQALPVGDYFAVAEASDPFGKNTARTVTWFSVGDVGLIVKYSPDKTVVRAVDLNTLKGVSGVDIKLYNKNETSGLKQITHALTAGSDGLATIAMSPALKSALGSTLVVTGELGKARAYGGFSPYQSDNDTHKTYFYTDRPVYRLGQTVCFKGLSRLVDASGMRNIGEGKELTLTVEDPDNNEMQKLTVKTNKHGTFHGLINIPENGKTGGYQVQVGYPDGHTDYESFEVAEYRKPEYQVDVTPLGQRFVEGQKGRAKVKASYYFGGPVANARVKWSAYSSNDYALRWRILARPSYFDFFNGWDNDETPDYESTGDMIKEGYCVTDANGEAIIEFDTNVPTAPADSPLGQEFADQKIKVEAEVTDISRLSVVGSGSLPFTAGDFFLTATPTNYVLKAGENVGLDVQATDYDGKPVPGAKVDVKIVRYPYDHVKLEYKPQVVVNQSSATTGNTGAAHLDMNVGNQMPSDSYSLQVTSTDKAGHMVGEHTSVWVSNSGDPFSLSLRDAAVEPMTIKLNKKVYQPGDVARAIVAGPFNGKSGMDALVCIEGRRLHDIKVLPLTSSAQLIEIPIKGEYAPNCYITVSMVGARRQFYTQEQMILVSPESHFLKLAVSADKTRYKPGETVKYTISAKDAAGKPAKNVELSLGVVDESIYSIRAETAANIQKFFYDRVPNWVSTFCSFPEQYSGGPDKLEPRVRKDFRDTAAWIPELITDDKGEAHAAVKLPDNLTTWRATVRGIDMQTFVGSATSKVIATQDIIARLALPRFFAQGDQGLVTAIVHNYSDKPQKVKLALSISNAGSDNPLAVPALTLGPVPATTIDIPADGAGRVNYPVNASGIGNVKIKLVATCPSGGDALEKELYVKALGLPVTIVKSGCLAKDNDQTQIDLNLPADAVAAGSITRSLGLASSSIGPVLGNFSALIDYPYGCTEQTMSRLVPSVVAMQLNRKLGVPLAKADSAKFAKVYKLAMEKLTSYQHGDGGWGWWPADQSNSYLTPLVLEGLKNLQDAGYKVDPIMAQRGLVWTADAIQRLTGQLTDKQHVKDDYFDRERETDLAYMLYSRSLWPKQKGDKPGAAAAEVKAVAYLSAKINTLSPEAVAYLARALKLKGDDTQAKTCLDRLIDLSNSSDATVDWEATRAMSKKLGLGPDNYYSYRFTPEETTALALQAVLEVGEGNSDLIEKSKNWLMLERGKDGWGSTKTTAAVFKALLADELKARVAAGDSSGPSAIASQLEKIAVSLAGKAITDLELGANQYGPQTIVGLGTKGGNLSIQKSGAGRLYYSATTDYFQSLAGDKVPAAMANMPQDLKIERSFYHLSSGPSTADGVIHVKAVPIANGQIKAGETILMKVKVTSPRSMPYIILEADLPSGAEVVQSENQDAAVSKDNEDTIQGDWGTPWWTHQDILDDKIVYFGTSLHEGKSEFTTLLRMELPGKVQINPVKLEGMYSKAIKAFSVPLQDRLQVNE
ncbi:MAG: carboxypeptidase regulatory-like domain-containing protein [Cyanobacteria bacterium REEB67]|nr:carboxypeptidase regulatory-like domain-containing protein [Cyanobacteria bacterium REEB67]